VSDKKGIGMLFSRGVSFLQSLDEAKLSWSVSVSYSPPIEFQASRVFLVVIGSLFL